MCSIDDILSADDLVSVMSREVAIRVLNVSGSGCLVESTTPLDDGTMAALTLWIDGEEYTDDVRVIRCQRVEGAGSTFRLGAEFVWTTRPGARALRRVARRLQHLSDRGGAEAAMELRLVM